MSDHEIAREVCASVDALKYSVNDISGTLEEIQKRLAELVVLHKEYIKSTVGLPG